MDFGAYLVSVILQSPRCRRRGVSSFLVFVTCSRHNLFDYVCCTNGDEQVDDLNHKDQNDVIHALSTMNDEDDYSQLFVEMTHAYKPFDLEQAKQDEIEDPTFIPIFLRCVIFCVICKYAFVRQQANVCL